MFSLKIDERHIQNYKEGITLSIGDIFKINQSDLMGNTENDFEILSLKTIEHYNADVFIVSFENHFGLYAFSINDLLTFKCNACIQEVNKRSVRYESRSNRVIA